MVADFPENIQYDKGPAKQRTDATAVQKTRPRRFSSRNPGDSHGIRRRKVEIKRRLCGGHARNTT